MSQEEVHRATFVHDGEIKRFDLGQVASFVVENKIPLATAGAAAITAGANVANTAINAGKDIIVALINQNDSQPPTTPGIAP